MTEWAVIPGHVNYEASTDGRIAERRIRGERRILPQGVNVSGHHTVNLCAQKLYVHRLVLLAFKGEPPTGKPYGCHRDDDPSHNHLQNLYWGSPADNGDDAKRNNRLRKGRYKQIPIPAAWAPAQQELAERHNHIIEKIQQLNQQRINLTRELQRIDQLIEK